MTKNQIKYLKMLGYTNTQEDGAILQHSQFSGMDAYVWDDDKFLDVIANFTNVFENALRNQIANEIRKI